MARYPINDYDKEGRIGEQIRRLFGEEEEEEEEGGGEERQIMFNEEEEEEGDERQIMFKEEEEEEGEERHVMFKRRRKWRSSRSVVLENEEEFIDQVKVVVAAAQDQRKPLHALLNDLELFDCPICYRQFLPPIFQCENGHIVCSSCCSKVKNKCPFCCMLIGSRCRGLEKLLESMSILCKYAKNGCNTTTLYTKKREHEEICCHATFFCPLCYFGSFTLQVYEHFFDDHEDCTTRFTYDTTFTVSIDMHHTQLFFQEQIGSPVFILNHDAHEHGRTFYLVCVGLSTLKNKFAYQLTAENMDTSLSLNSVPTMYKNYSKDTPIGKYLTVPFEFADDSGLLTLSVCIRKRVLFDLETEEKQNLDFDPSVFRNLKVVLNDPFVLSCPICLELLWHPIFQCKNGHLACSSCCSKLKNICSCCGYRYNRCRGLEKVTESVKMISCKNAKNGYELAMP